MCFRFIGTDFWYVILKIFAPQETALVLSVLNDIKVFSRSDIYNIYIYLLLVNQN